MTGLINWLGNISISDWFSAFSGFGTALLAEAIIRLYNKKKQRKELLCRLEKELQEISDTVRRRIAMPAMEYDSKPYDIPIWESACITGSIGLLSDYTIYRDLVMTFSYIQETNFFENECFKAFILCNQEDKKRIVKLQECRRSVDVKTEEMLEKIKKLG